MKNRKLDIVTHLLCSDSRHRNHNPEQAMITWWYNVRDTGGLRLTDAGYHVMTNVFEVASWQMSIQDPKKSLTKRVILDMDQKLEWPYYIDYRNRRVVFFGSQEAVMATLYGDLHAWLKNRPARSHEHDSH